MARLKYCSDFRAHRAASVIAIFGAAGLFVAAHATPIRAATVLVDPTSSAASSSYGGTQATWTITGIGFVTPGTDTSVDNAEVATGSAPPTTYPGYTNDYNGYGMWLSAGAATDPSPTITWALGTGATTYNLTGFHLWNSNQNGPTAGLSTTPNGLYLKRGIVTGTISVAGTDGVFHAVTLLGQTAGSSGFTLATGTYGDTGTTYNFASSAYLANVQQVEFSNMQNPNSDGYYQLSQIRFLATTPEPATAGLVGLGGLGMLLLGKRRKGTRA